MLRFQLHTAAQQQPTWHHCLPAHVCVSDTSDRSLGVRAGGRDAVVAASLLYRQVLVQPRVHDVHEEAWEQRLVAEKAEGF